MAVALNKITDNLLEFLKSDTFHQIKHIPLGMSVTQYSVSLSTWSTDITEDQMRQLKRSFGPLQYTGGATSKDATARIAISDTFDVTLRVHAVMECEPLKIENGEVTDEQIATLIEQVKSGIIKPVECKTSPFMEVQCSISDCCNKVYNAVDTEKPLCSSCHTSFER